MLTHYLLFLFSTLFLLNSGLQAAISEADKKILIDFYHATNGAEWDNNKNWLNGDPCTWYGILCKENNQLEINLSGNNVNGTFPENFAHLSNLTSLKLGVIYIEESGHSFRVFTNTLVLPNNFGDLKQLATLDLSLALETPPHLPESFFKLPSLTYLNLSSNNFIKLPENLDKLTQLKILFLANMGLSQIPDSFKNLINLKRLSLSSNSLVSLPESFDHLTQIENLALTSNKLVLFPVNMTNIYIDDNPIVLKTKREIEFIFEWVTIHFYNLFYPPTVPDQVFSIDDPNSPYAGHWFFKHYPATGIYIGFKPNKKRNNYNVYVFGGELGSNITFIDSLPNIIKSLPKEYLCIDKIASLKAGTILEYDYQTPESKGSLSINIKVFNNEKSVIEKHLILPNRIENKVETQLFSIKEGFKNLEKVITEFDNGLITTVIHEDPYPLEFKEYCSQNPNKAIPYRFFQEGLFSSNQNADTFPTPRTILTFNKIHVEVTTAAGTFDTINETREDLLGSQITEKWIDIKTGLTIIKREYNREGVVVYNQVLREIR